jgi:peptidoglycan/xylan/chitin deacetylase (PgdA/CDA1 family)
MFDASGPSPATQPDLRREPPAGDWRRGAAAVVCLTFGFDTETSMLSDASGHARDISAMSHQAYGRRVGVPRILELAHHGLPATFFVPGGGAQRWPATVEAILARGHEVACHRHTHRSLLQMTEAEQVEDLERALQPLLAIAVGALALAYVARRLWKLRLKRAIDAT